MLHAQAYRYGDQADSEVYINPQTMVRRWDSVLYISPNTGVTDVVMDPRNPDVLYAASYQRRRHVWTLINGGPEGAIHKSTDGGKTWNKLTSGLPSGDVGRIGLAISSG
ncbi:MAG: hypothetical protein MZV64_05500 [Ignavibacteriales bacterium]|nr:hypothetical protein [Ignavibacteriales bacterium]